MKNDSTNMERKEELDIELGEDIAMGNYSNLAIISHSSSEFVLDFAALMPGVPKAKVHSRIILAPEHAKRLLLSLQDNITKYETHIGRIEIPNASSSESEEQENITLGFNMGEA